LLYLVPKTDSASVTEASIEILSESPCIAIERELEDNSDLMDECIRSWYQRIEHDVQLALISVMSPSCIREGVIDL
jgi:hypothetical protein